MHKTQKRDSKTAEKVPKTQRQIPKSLVSMIHKEKHVLAKDSNTSNGAIMKQRAKERDDMVLEYMRHMDEAKRRSIFAQFENLTHTRIALNPIDGNVANLGIIAQNTGYVTSGEASSSMTSLMDVSGIMVPHSLNSCQ